MPIVSIDVTTSTTLIYILYRFRSYRSRYRLELMQRISKSAQIKKTQILYIRMNLMSVALSITRTLMPSAIETSTLTRISLLLSVNIILNFLISISIRSVSIRRKKSRYILQNSVQIRSQQTRRISLIRSNVYCIIQYLLTTEVFQIVKTLLNYCLILIAEPELASYI